MTFFLIMIFSFSLLKDIRRVFQYHGAEHKTVFTWEAGLPLTVANARPQPRQAVVDDAAGVPFAVNDQ